MFKKFFVRAALKRHTASLPKEQRDMVETMLEENPDVFMQLAQEVQAEVKAGKDQNSAFMAVAERNKGKLQALMSKQKRS